MYFFSSEENVECSMRLIKHHAMKMALCLISLISLINLSTWMPVLISPPEVANLAHRTGRFGGIQNLSGQLHKKNP